ncbi:hypothetical protein L1987_06366 [Smallanthus sonchifolius]|uniref:Uncharacterized protein n=1 Tax=Smallanthus sonchifolius TaxID=185202 RepID=A0ACB9JXZ2_9ASTR|nr:hypothetical protein L1987_06366 [Smallanthus sonchifolius]
MDSIGTQNYQESGSSVYPLVPYSPDSSPESYHPSPLSSHPSQNVDQMGTQNYEDGVPQLITKHSPLSWGQNLFDLNRVGYVNDDQKVVDDVEDVEVDQADQVIDCIARRKLRRLTRHPRCDTG